MKMSRQKIEALEISFFLGYVKINAIFCLDKGSSMCNC